MIRVRCNKCPKEVGAEDSGGWEEILVTSQNRKMKNLSPDVYHLCPQCSTSFDEFIVRQREPDLKAIKVGDE